MKEGKFRPLKLVAAELSGKTVLGGRGGAGAGQGTSVAWTGACLHLGVCVGISPDVASGRASSAELWQWAGPPGLNI